MPDRVYHYTARLRWHDPELTSIRLSFNKHTDSELAELVDCLIAYPNVVTRLVLSVNRLTDETGVKLARFVAASTTIEWLSLHDNQFGKATYLALAAALRVNTSLRLLNLDYNQKVDRTRVDAAFVAALRINPSRPASSMWFLYSTTNDLQRFQREANALGHPTLQTTLSFLLDAPTRPFKALLH